jgi:desulfoferrodoxin (superoxide reductase-like protein)
MFTSLLLLSSLTFLIEVKADVPIVLKIEVDEEDEHKLVITVRHGNPTLIHYVNEIQIELDGELSKLTDLDPQSEVEFIEEYNIDSEVENVRVRVKCNVHGWSSWENYEIKNDAGKKGIPGFPLESVIIGLLAFSVISITLRIRYR